MGTQKLFPHSLRYMNASSGNIAKAASSITLFGQEIKMHYLYLEIEFWR